MNNPLKIYYLKGTALKNTRQIEEFYDKFLYFIFLMASHYLNTSQMNTNMTLKNPGDQNIGKLVCKNYIILKKLNEGSFGKVY